MANYWWYLDFSIAGSQPFGKRMAIAKILLLATGEVDIYFWHTTLFHTPSNCLSYLCILFSKLVLLTLTCNFCFTVHQELIFDLGQAVRIRKIQFLSHQFKIGTYVVP